MVGKEKRKCTDTLIITKTIMRMLPKLSSVQGVTNSNLSATVSICMIQTKNVLATSMVHIIISST